MFEMVVFYIWKYLYSISPINFSSLVEILRTFLLTHKRAEFVSVYKMSVILNVSAAGFWVLVLK